MKKILIILNLIIANALFGSNAQETRTKNNADLLCAARENSHKLLKSALESGNVDINTKDSNDKSVISLAIANGCPESFIGLLIKHGVDLSGIDINKLASNMHVYREDDLMNKIYLLRKWKPYSEEFYTEKEQTPIVLNKYLVTDLATIVTGYLSIDFHGWIKLWHPRSFPQLDMLGITNKEVKDYYSTINDNNNWIESIHTENRKLNNALIIYALKFLVNPISRMHTILNFDLKNFDIDIRNSSGATLFMLALNNTDIPGAELLLKHGAYINAEDCHGRTALIYAAMYGKDDVVKFLLKNKADVTIKSGEGKTALDYAKQRGKKDIVKLLEDYIKENKITLSQSNSKSSLCIVQ